MSRLILYDRAIDTVKVIDDSEISSIENFQNKCLVRSVPDYYPESGTFNKVTLQVEPDFITSKLLASSRITDNRTTAEDSGCITPYGRIDTDPVSRGRLSGAVQLAMISQSLSLPFSIKWKMEDNSSSPSLNAAQFIQLGIVVAMHSNDVFNQANILKLNIDKATTQAELDIITWESYIPGQGE